MLMDNIINEIKKDYKLDVKYKDTSFLMKLLSLILFFNKDFMKSFTTTIGTTIYYPSEEFVKNSPITSLITLLHELVHIIDYNKNKLLFTLLYLFPQILAIFALPLFFISWKFSAFFLLFLLPLPAYFRMKYERKAYAVSLYVIKQLSLKKNFKVELEKQKDNYISYFKKSDYYYMWIFKTIDSDFNEYLLKIENNERPFKDEIFDLIDKYIDFALK
jgi:hypothetical protein